MKKEYYADYSRLEETHWWFRGRRRILIDVLQSRLSALAANGGPPDILDIGCGTGGMLAALGRLGLAHGIDSEPEALRFCRQRGLQRVQLQSDPSLPFPPETFDAVTLLDVLEHLDEPVAMLREARRVLRPSGVVMVAVPAYQMLWGRQDVISHHRRRYRAREVASELAAAGLEVDRLTYFNTILFPPIAAIRLLQRLLPAPADPGSDFEFPAPAPLNGLLAAMLGAEAGLLRRLDLPFGVSILALAGIPRT